jgi:hypothetical protein
MLITTGNFDGGRKLLNYPKYTKNSDPDTHVHVFKQVIKVNGVA